MGLLSMSLMFSQNSAPSSHMGSNDSGSGDILMKTVRSTITTKATYYCTMQWNAGAEGGAYCGFQDSPDKGKVFIYSIWDPSNKQAIKASYIGPGTTVENFGGEGTGLKSMNNLIGWNLNEWNTVVTRRWDVANHTYFGFWVRRDSQNKWYHMVTMDYPVANVTFNGSTNAFLEDWLSTGSNTRRFEMKDAFKRKTDGSWLPMTQGRYNRNNESRSSNYTNAVDAGANNGIYFMQSGGNTSPSFSGNPPITFSTTANPTPTTSVITFNLTSSSTSSVSWNVPDSATPQFRYTIKLNGQPVSSAIEPETRSATISGAVGDTVEVVLEDILGRTSSQSTTISQNSNILSDGIYKITFENSSRALNAAGSNNGDNINLSDYNGNSNQQWQVSSLGNGEYKIINVSSGKSADAFGQNNGSNIGLYVYHGGTNQRWKITNLSGNTYKVIDSRSSRAMDAYGTGNGANVGLYDYHGNANQRIQFTRLSSSTGKSSNVAASDGLDVKIYPNPASNLLNVEIPNPEGIKQNIEIYNVQGTYITGQSVQTKSAKAQFNIANYPKGIYLLKIGNTTHKVMIQ